MSMILGRGNDRRVLQGDQRTIAMAKLTSGFGAGIYRVTRKSAWLKFLNTATSTYVLVDPTDEHYGELNALTEIAITAELAHLEAQQAQRPISS